MGVASAEAVAVAVAVAVPVAVAVAVAFGVGTYLVASSSLLWVSLLRSFFALTRVTVVLRAGMRIGV